MRRSLAIAASIAAFAASSAAFATPTTSTANCSSTVFIGLSASACLGSFTGNINGASSELAALAKQWDETFTYAGSSDEKKTFGPFASNPSGSGTITLVFDQALTSDFVIGLKAANAYSYYFFDIDSPVTSVTFDTTAGVSTNRKGVAQDLSHAVLYLGSTEITTTAATVPEPGTYALMLSALALMAAAARRRRQR